MVLLWLHAGPQLRTPESFLLPRQQELLLVANFSFLSARQDVFLPHASVSPQCWDVFSDAHAYLLGLCPAETFTGGWREGQEGPSKALQSL